MPAETASTRNWFDRGGRGYAHFRPEYPLDLSQVIAAMAPSHRPAVDVGCGSGQLSTQLARHVDLVVGLDPSADQLAHAAAHDGVRYVCARAEEIPLADHSVGLVTAAQSAHWFDLPAFYAEVRRIGVPGAVVALISYGVPELDAELHERFSHFYWHEIGPYWPAERRLVESGYCGLDFPFAERAVPPMRIRREWDLDHLLGYIGTWSAVRRAAEDAHSDLLDSFARDLAQGWGDPHTARSVTWPINLRAGRL